MNFWPSHTRGSLVPLKHACHINPDVLPEYTAPDFEMEYIDIGNVTLEHGIGERQSLKFGQAPSRARRPVRMGDTIISTVRPYLKAIAYIDSDVSDWVVSTGFAVLRPKPGVHPQYLYRVTQSEAFVSSVVVSSTGISYPAINPSALGDLDIPIPDHLTQKCIAQFLDHETARIDQLVTKKRRLVEVLRDKLAHEIDAAVTIGLSLTCPRKSTGIPWVPEVPQHWGLVRAKYLYREAMRPPLDEDEVITAFRDGQVTLRENRRTEGFTVAVKEVGYQHIEVGDLVIHSMDAFAGAIGVSDSSGKATGEYAVCMATSDEVNNHYFAHLLRCMARRDFIYVLCPSVRERAPRFRYARFAPVVLPIPPRAEQDEIVDHLDRIKLRYLHLVEKTNESLDRLQELRSSLITAAVTGQIDPDTWRKRGNTDRHLEALAKEASL